MFYRVNEEDCYNGIKSRFSVNQKITDNDLYYLMSDFKDYKYEIVDSLNNKNFKFFKLDLFRRKEVYYQLYLTKCK